MKRKLLDQLLSNASWLASHADALSVCRREKDARSEWLRAAACAEQVACLLEAEKRDVEAAVHYVSAASCYAKVQQHARAVPLLRAALSFDLRDAYRRDLEKLLKDWLPKAKKHLRRQARQQAVAAARV